MPGAIVAGGAVVACLSLASSAARADAAGAGAGAVVVLAVEPGATVSLFEGESDGSIWKRASAAALTEVASDDRFLVLRLKPRVGREVYGVGAYRRAESGRAFVADVGAAVPAFHAPPGQVTFVGALSLEANGKATWMDRDLSVDDDAVERFVRERHPELGGPLAVEKLRMLTADGDVDHEGTPRGRIVSGGAIGFSAGLVSLRGGVGDRAAIGDSASVGALTVSGALWDHLTVAFWFTRLKLADRQPFSQLVVDCTTTYGVVTGCGDPRTQTSDVLATTVGLEAGYQHRFRPTRLVSIVPAVVVGYTWNPGGFSRQIVGCDDCRSVGVAGVHAGGVSAGPTLKVTVASWFALSLRSELFVGGDMASRTLLGLEVGAP